MKRRLQGWRLSIFIDWDMAYCWEEYIGTGGCEVIWIWSGEELERMYLSLFDYVFVRSTHVNL